MVSNLYFMQSNSIFSKRISAGYFSWAWLLVLILSMNCVLYLMKLSQCTLSFLTRWSLYLVRQSFYSLFSLGTTLSYTFNSSFSLGFIAFSSSEESSRSYQIKRGVERIFWSSVSNLKDFSFVLDSLRRSPNSYFYMAPSTYSMASLSCCFLLMKAT